MGHDSVVKNPSQVWGGDNSVFNQIGGLFDTPTPQGMQAPPPPPNNSMAAAGSLQNDLNQEKQQYSASNILTGGQGVSGPPRTSAPTLIGW